MPLISRAILSRRLLLAITLSPAAFLPILLPERAGEAQVPKPKRSNEGSARGGMADEKKSDDPSRPRGKGMGKGEGKKGADRKSKGAGGPRHVFAGPPPAHPFDVILGRPADRSVVVSLMAYKPLEAYVTWGSSAEDLSHKSSVRRLGSDETFEWTLTDLAANQANAYRLHVKLAGADDFTAEPVRTFHTRRARGESFSFTVQADSHLDQGTAPEVYERTLNNALADRPDFHVDLGDTFMTDKYPEHTDALPQYLAQRYYFSRIAHSVPLFLVLGNHDGERLDRDDGTADCMPAWSARMRKKYIPNPYPDDFYRGNPDEVKHVGKLGNYFAFDWGDAQIIGLDPFRTTPRKNRNDPNGNWVRTLGEAQYRWLKRTLEGSKAKYRFVFIHHLVGGVDDSARGGSEAAELYEWGGRGATGKPEFKTRRPGWEMPIHDLLRKHKVAAVLHGHDHFFAKQDLDDIVYLMVPQPGPAGGDRLRNVDEYGYVRGVFLPSPGHVRVTIGPEAATVDYVRSHLPRSETSTKKNGEVAFSFKIRR